jgi:hypothetical protein
MATEVKGTLGFDLTPVFIAARAIWAQTVQCTKCTGQLTQLFLELMILLHECTLTRSNVPKKITHQLHLARTHWLLKHFSTTGPMTYGHGSK